MQKLSKLCLSFLWVSLLTMSVFSQNEFAATLEVISTGVEVKRIHTDSFIAIEFEVIVGVGDVIRTDDTGEARITFFADGTDTVLENNTEYLILEFSGDDEDFQLEVEVLAGQTIHRLNRVLSANSRYDVGTPGMTLAAQGTEFRIRVEDDGRAAMLVTEGVVETANDDLTANVPAEFGIRSEVNQALSDVVRASSFDELDSALDGCTVNISTPDDVSINVRLGPGLEQPRVGYITAEDIDTFSGINESGNWYRIEFAGNFGWVLSSTVSIVGNCSGLRVFEDTHAENVELYQNLTENIDLSTVPVEVTEETPVETDSGD